MNDKNPAPPKNPARIAREKRLAEALRANLRRRKEVGEPRAGGIAGTKPQNLRDSGGGKDEGG
jgi:hypothetical protein